MHPLGTAYDIPSNNVETEMAILIGWKDYYCIDQGPIDDQHKRLVQLANSVLAITDPLSEEAELRKTVKELFQYMEYHFDAEEQLMQKIAYPELDEHKKIHAGLIHDLNELLKTSRNYHHLLNRLKPVMKNWVLRHIEEEDSKIGAYLASTATA